VVGLVALPILIMGRVVWHFPAFRERGLDSSTALESEGQFVLLTMRSPDSHAHADAHWEYADAHWNFKWLIPANHLAHVVFVRWTDGAPKVEPGGFSAYFKVGKPSMDANFHLSCESLAEAPSSGETNGVQWNVNLTTHETYSVQFPGEPLYRLLETPARLTVRSGHQGVLRLVDYVKPKGESSHSPSGVELRIFLEPLKSPPIRTDPFEIEGSNYVAGHGPGWTMEETLKAIKQWPADR
jgi:hypothetical protein